VLQAAEAQHPVDVVVHHVQRALAAALASEVLVDDELADRAQAVRVERGAGGVERRVEAEQARAGQHGLERPSRGQELVLGAADERHALGTRQVRVVVVVPARHRVDDAVAGSHDRPEQRVDERPRSARDHERLEGVVELQLAGVEALHRLAQRDDAVRGRVVGLALRERLRDRVAQHVRDGEVPGSKSPTVRSHTAWPAAFRLRTSPAILRISDPMRPEAKREKRAEGAGPGSAARAA
jgi:hypothetical protein